MKDRHDLSQAVSLRKSILTGKRRCQKFLTSWGAEIKLVAPIASIKRLPIGIRLPGFGRCK